MPFQHSLQSWIGRAHVRTLEFLPPAPKPESTKGKWGKTPELCPVAMSSGQTIVYCHTQKKLITIRECKAIAPKEDWPEWNTVMHTEEVNKQPVYFALQGEYQALWENVFIEFDFSLSNEGRYYFICGCRGKECLAVAQWQVSQRENASAN